MLIATPVQKSHGILGTIDRCSPSVDASSSCMFRQIISRQCTWVTKRGHSMSSTTTDWFKGLLLDTRVGARVREMPSTR